jgi:hypothetical protein
MNHKKAGSTRKDVSAILGGRSGADTRLQTARWERDRLSVPQDPEFRNRASSVGS